jgi:hypothetical protein
LNDHPALIERLKQASQAGDENTAVALRMFNELVDGVEAQGWRSAETLSLVLDKWMLSFQRK